MKDHVIICGLGEIGFQIFTLLQRLGIPAAVISNKTHAEWAWQIEQSANLFFCADARDDNVLLEAGIKDAKALLTLTNDDHINFSIAVDAKKLNPNIKIISRIYDTELGNLLSDSFDIEQVFSSSELAAPLFSKNIVDKKILGEFSAHQKNYIVKETTNNITQDSMTLAHFNDTNLVAEVEKTSIQKSSLFKSLRLTFRKPAFTYISYFLTILFCIILFSTLLLSYTMPLTMTNALYFVTATITSVGYGDINFLHSSSALKYFGCILMLTGTAIIAVLFSSIMEMVILKRLPKLAGGFDVPKKNHVILVGDNRIGTKIINNLLAESIPIVIIEKGVEPFPEDISRQVSVVNGNPSSTNTLNYANVKHAKAIIAVTKDDIENLSIGLAAKKLNLKLIELLQINNTQIRGSLKKALISAHMHSVPFIAAPYFIAAILQPKILFAIEWHNQLIYLYDDHGKINLSFLPLKNEINLIS